jgi:hypothetical protein
MLQQFGDLRLFAQQVDANHLGRRRNRQAETVVGAEIGQRELGAG